MSNAIADRCAEQLAVPVSLPPRKEWDAARAGRDVKSSDYVESSDYVDGWNDALDAALAARLSPGQRAELEQIVRGEPTGGAVVDVEQLAALSSADVRELAERRALDDVRRAEIEELVARRKADLSAEERVVLRRHRDEMGRIFFSTPESRAVLALLDRLLASGAP